MQEYDAVLKRVLMRFTPAAAGLVTGFEARRWLNVELPDVRVPRVDLLGEKADGGLFHIELQRSNDPDMALRMAEYALAIYRMFRKRPDQLVLYAGEAPLSMPRRLWEFECRMVDIRDFDAGPLLESPGLADNLIAILMRYPDRRETVRRILRRIAEAEPERRGEALAELAKLAGLRGLGPMVREEAKRMPIIEDIMDDLLIGPLLREGIQTGERNVVVRMLEKRFGRLPAWASDRLGAMTTDQLESAADRLFDSVSLEELLG